MEVPARLYKYRMASLQDITNLSDAKLWISSPKSFNDPFDCAYDLDAFIPSPSREECASLLHCDQAKLASFSEHELRQQVVSALKQVLAQVRRRFRGVSCFSTVKDNLLMWSHYAQQHEGFCLEFSTCHDVLFQKARRVQYTNAIPTLNVKQFANFDFDQVLSLALTKEKSWEYEKEWRVLHEDADFLYGYRRSSLTGIYFGAKMAEPQRAMIASLLKKTHTKLYRMHLSNSSFELTAEQVDFEEIDYRNAQPGESAVPPEAG